MDQGVNLNFDASTVAPINGQPDPLPDGWYKAIIDQSTKKATKDQTGEYVEIRFSVIEGQHNGRKIFTRFNLRNANPQAQQMAYGQLSALCRAVGIMQVGNTMQMHNIPLQIRVITRPAQGQYEASNEIKQFEHINSPVAGQGAGGAVPAFPGNGSSGFPATMQPQGQPALPSYQPPAQPQNQPPPPPQFAQPQQGFPQQQPPAQFQPPAQPGFQPQQPDAAQFPQQQPAQPWAQPQQPQQQPQAPAPQAPGPQPWAQPGQGQPQQAQPAQQQPQGPHPMQSAPPPWQQ